MECLPFIDPPPLKGITLGGVVVSKTPLQAFLKLSLPQIRQFHHDDLPNKNMEGQDSSHRTLTHFPNDDVDLEENENSPPLTTMGAAIIYCDGAMDQGKPARFASTVISPLEMAFLGTDQPCDIPTLIGLPIWMRPYHHDPTIDRTNVIATWLHVLGDIEDEEGFGLAARTWQDSALVVRMDGKTLLPQHLEVLSFFCRHVFEQVIGEGFGEVGLSDDKETREIQVRNFKKIVTQSGFMAYYQNYCATKSAVDIRWRNLPSPFDSRTSINECAHLINDYQLSKMQAIKDEEMEEAAPRRSGRQPRISSRVLETSMDFIYGFEDEASQARGRTKKRKSSFDDHWHY